MPVETFGFIDSLNSSNPPTTDGLSQGDDHIRGIKATLKAQFPNLSAVVNATAAQFAQLATGIYTLVAGSTGSPSLMFVDTATAFFKKATAQIGFNGTLRGKGAVAVGSIHMFPKLPGGSQIATASTPGTTFEYLECNGALYLVADYADLAAFYGNTFGGDGVTNFGVPDAYTAGKFLRSRTASLAVGTAQTNQNKQHTHTFSATAGSDGSHGHTASSSVTDPGHNHVSAPYNQAVKNGTNSVVDVNFSSTEPDLFTTGTISPATTGISVSTTVNAGGVHTHSVSGTTDNDSGGTEARPEALAVIFAVKS